MGDSPCKMRLLSPVSECRTYGLVAQLNRANGRREPRLEVEREEENTRRDTAQTGNLRDVRAHPHERQEDCEPGQVRRHRLPLVDLGGVLDGGGPDEERDPATE